MNTDDDVMWLREVLTGHDPAIPGRAVLASPPPQRSRRRPARWGGAALAAAAVVAAVVIPVTLSQGARTAAPAAADSSNSGAAQPAPAPRPGYDHLRRKDYDGTTLTTTTEWWWNGVSGRELKTDKAGKVLSDVTLALPPDPGAVGNGSPAGPVATQAPTSGVEHMADDFPGAVPTTEQQLRSYMQIKASDPADQVAQRASSLVLQRALTPNQMKVLASILTALPTSNPVTNTVAPDGREVQVLHQPANNMGGSTETVLNQSGTAVLGMTWRADGHTYWQLLTLSEISTTTR